MSEEMPEQIRRVLTAAAIEVAACDPRHPQVKQCLDTYFAELADRYGGFDPAISRPLPADDMTPPAGLLLMARLHDVPVGCGALKYLPEGVAAIKRMWVSPDVRGLGLGRRILDELEESARANGVRLVRLETKNELYEAVHMYRGSGYREVQPFNDEFYADRWLEKVLTSDKERGDPGNAG
jgi:ribosomal protein S18 acetylase RimI-like enzyme